MTVYGLKSCDTCRKALKVLDGAEFVDVRADCIPDPVLERAVHKFGADLINRRSTTWRTLSESDRALAPAVLIAAHPTVMKRPLIVQGDALWLGWSPETRADLGVA